MLVFQPWKSWTTIIVCVLGVLLALPNLASRATLDKLPSWLPKNQISLGLDLQGGVHLLLEVDLASVTTEQLNNSLDALRTQLIKEKIGYTSLTVDKQQILVTLRDPADAAKLQPLVHTVDADLTVTTQPNGVVTIGFSPQAQTARQTDAVERSINVVRKRIDELGTREPTIAREGADRILVQVPGYDDPEKLKELIGKTAKLTFQMVDPTGDVEEAEKGHVPPGDELVPAEQSGPKQLNQAVYLLRKRVIVDGGDLLTANFTFRDNEPVIVFKFNASGARRFGDATTQNVGKLFAIVLDGHVLSAPVIREPFLGGTGEISGSFTSESAQNLALLLRAGALPAPLTILEQSAVGPDLGADSIRAGTTACVVAVGLVAVFMVLFYGLFGIYADIALFFNLALLIAALSLLGATLTLPGIAGIALTLGMAVDANVLVNERIREEVRMGRTMISAIDAGFTRAYATILDANFTHLIAGGCLFMLGSGPVKGFAVTLCLGILTSLFTTIMVSRLFVVWWLRRRPKLLPI